MITDSPIIQFVVIVIGLGSIGRIFFGMFGAYLGLILGIFLFWQLRKNIKKNVDYDRIEAMFQKYMGRR